MSRRQTLSLQHVFAGERLQGFSDAVFAIIATFMVVPLTVHVSVDDVLDVLSLEGQLLDSAFLIKYWIYLFSFGMVTDTWYTHVGIFSIIEQVDGVILSLNLLVLLFVSALPISYVLLVGSYGLNPSIERTSIVFCSGNIAIGGIVLAVMLIYAFRKQKLLHPEISKSSDIRIIKYTSLFSILIKPFFAIVTLVVTLTSKNNTAARVLFYCVGGVSLIVQIAVYIYLRIVKKIIDRLPHHIFKTVARKLRIEFFSDGVFSIVATLIILDISTSAGSTITSDKVSDILILHPHVITSYLMSFTIVGFLWLIHYQMFHFIKKLITPLVVINFWILFLVGLIPFASKVDVRFSKNELEATDLKKAAVQLKSCIVLLISLLEALFWIVALCNKRKCMSAEIELFNSESLQSSKIFVLPILSVIVYFGCLADGFITNHLHVVCFLCTPLVYLILDASFKCYGRIKQKRDLKAATRRILIEKMAESQTTDSVKTDLSYHSYRPCLKTQGSQRPRARALKVQISDTSYEYSYEGSYKYKEDLHQSLGYEQT